MSAPPLAVNDAATIAEDSAATTIDVLANDTDPDSDELSVVAESVTQPANGAATCTTTACTYTSDANFNGDNSFTYDVTDGVSVATATVSVIVTPVNDEPVLGVLEVTAVAGVPETFDVTSAATDVDGDPLMLVSFDQPANGLLECTDEGMCTYTADVNFAGNDTFTYELSDGAASAGMSFSRAPADIAARPWSPAP